MTDDRVDALYRRYGPIIYSRCRHILGDPVAASDATQETFLRLHRTLRDARDVNEALGWLTRVATNHCITTLRSQRRQAEPVAEVELGAELHFEEALHRADLARRLVAAVPAPLAEVAWLHHVDGLTQEEVARVLGISRRTVVYRLADFLEAARTLLGRGDPE